MTQQKLRVLALACAVAFSGCAANSTKETPAVAAATPAAGRDDVNTVLWMQTATEFEGLSHQAFRIAELEVKGAVEHLKFLKTMSPGTAGPLKRAYDQAVLQQRSWNALVPSERTGADRADEPLAVIVDADETIIDNSPYQARNIRDNKAFDRAGWNAWVNEKRARALPGAVDFAQFLAANDVTLFYVTNRDASLRDATAENLKALGFPLPADLSTLLARDEAKGWTGDKGTRRKFVDENYRVVLMMGDNLGDFVDGVYADVDARHALVAPYEGWWGQRWVVLPNPAYGSWENAVNQHCRDGVAPADARACKLSHLRTE